MASPSVDPPAVVETRVVHETHRRATSLLTEASRSPTVAPASLHGLRAFVVANLRHHHESEDDDLWALLTRRAPHLGASLAALGAEHDRLDAALDRLAHEGGADAAQAVRDMVHAHLAAEEPVLLAALRDHLSDADWDGFSRRTVASAPPVGTDLMIAFLHEVAAEEDVTSILRYLPDEAAALVPAMRADGERALAALREAIARDGHRAGVRVSPPSAGDRVVEDIDALNRHVIAEFRANAGRVGGRFSGATLLLLHTRGTRSGRERVNPVAYRREGDVLYVFASAGGGPRNPGWYHNLVANPDVVVEVGTESFAARARVLTGRERARVWHRQTRDVPTFADYERQTARQIPVVELRRTDP